MVEYHNMWTVKDLEAPRSTQEIALAHVRSNYNHERLIFFSKNQTIKTDIIVAIIRGGIAT